MLVDPCLLEASQDLLALLAPGDPFPGRGCHPPPPPPLPPSTPLSTTSASVNDGRPGLAYLWRSSRPVLPFTQYFTHTNIETRSHVSSCTARGRPTGLVSPRLFTTYSVVESLGRLRASPLSGHSFRAVTVSQPCSVPPYGLRSRPAAEVPEHILRASVLRAV